MNQGIVAHACDPIIWGYNQKAAVHHCGDHSLFNLAKSRFSVSSPYKQNPISTDSIEAISHSPGKQSFNDIWGHPESTPRGEAWTSGL